MRSTTTRTIRCLSFFVVLFLIVRFGSQLLPGDGIISTSGVVTRDSGETLPDATVTLVGPIGTGHEDRESTRTDSSGAFRLSLMFNPHAGREFTLRVEKPGFQPHEQTITPAGSRQTLRISLVPAGADPARE
jgi:hypothetical protein